MRTRALALAFVSVAVSSSTAYARVPERAVPPVTTPAPITAVDKCAPAAKTAVRVMVLDLKAAPAFSSTAKALGQIVAGEAARVAGFQILSADEVRTALDQEANKSLLGCDQNSCLAELAQALDAELVLGGRVDEADGGGALVSLTLLNARAIVVVNRVNMTWTGEPSELPEVVRAAAQTLVLEPKDRPPGSIQIVGLPSNARVFVDGVDRTGDFASGTIGGLAVGPHDIKAEANDKVAGKAAAVVKAGASTVVQMNLDDVPVPAVWLWLGGAGAVIAGGVGAVALAYVLGKGDAVVGATVPSVGVNDVETLGKHR